MTIQPGQKLYHFAYGPLTVIEVIISKNGDTVRTVMDDPDGYRFWTCSLQPTQMWLLDTVDHWLFQTADKVGSENNDFDWKKIWPHFEHAPTEPMESAKNHENWHKYFDAPIFKKLRKR